MPKKSISIPPVPDATETEAAAQDTVVNSSAEEVASESTNLTGLVEEDVVINEPVSEATSLDDSEVADNVEVATSFDSTEIDEKENKSQTQHLTSASSSEERHLLSEANEISEDDDNKEEKKKIAKALTELLETGNGYTPQQMQKWARLAAFRQRGKPVRATIVSTSVVRHGDEERVIVFFDIKGAEEFESFMDFDELDLVDNPDELEVPQKLFRATDMLGSSIDLIITSLDHGVCKGSTVLANKVLRKSYYYDGYYAKQSAKSLSVIGKGTKVYNVPIIRVTKRSIRVLVKGCKVSIPKSELSHLWIADTSEYYSVGQSVDILVTECTRLNDADYNVNLKASVKALLPNPTVEKLSRCREGDRYIATVIRIDFQAKQIFVSTDAGFNGRVGALPETSRPIHVGDRVVYRFKAVNARDKSIAYGDIIKIM